jgi:hypothetical protein
MKTGEKQGQPQTPEITGHPQGGYTAALNSAGISLTVTAKAPSGGGALSYQWYRAESATAEGTTVASARAEIRVDASLAPYTPDQFGGKETEADWSEPCGLQPLWGLRNLLTHQMADDLRGSLMGAVSLCTDIGGGKIVHFHQMRHVLRKIAGFAGIYGGSGLCPQFVQSVRFGFGHACHVSLLLFYEAPPCFAAFHRVKYIDMPTTDNVVQDFEQIGVCVKADEQILIILSCYSVIKDIVLKGRANIGFGNTVPESRLIKLNTGAHILTIA